MDSHLNCLNCLAVANEAEVPAPVAENPAANKAVPAENEAINEEIQGDKDDPDDVEFKVDAPNPDPVIRESTDDHFQRF